MSETLLQHVLFLLDRIESPTISHARAVDYSDEALAGLISNGILGKKLKATNIPRPARFGPGDDVVVRETSDGLFGVAEENDYIEPLPLEENDTRVYEISVPHLVDAIRKENNVAGSGYRNDNGLIFIGQRSVDGVGVIDVYLSLPNSSEDSVLARCRRLVRIAGERWGVLLTPCPLDILIEDRGILASDRIVTISLMAGASQGHLRVNWTEAIGYPALAVGALSLTGATGTGPKQADLERLIQAKERVDISTARAQEAQGPQESRKRKKPVRRNQKYKVIDKALKKIDESLPSTQEEIFRYLDSQHVIIPPAEPFVAAHGWMAGFRRDTAAARAWLSKRWAELNLSPLPRGPKNRRSSWSNYSG